MTRRFVPAGLVGIIAIVSILLAAAFAVGFVVKIATTPEDDNTSGPGLPVVITGETYSGSGIAIDGTLTINERGCFLIRMGSTQPFAIWPQGFTTGGDAVITNDGQRIERGDSLRGSGTFVEYDTLVADTGGPDGYWASVAGFCHDPGEDVIVLDELD